MNPIVLLCTGGIGSGKSFVVKVFNALGIPSYDCDSAAKDLYDRDSDLLAGVARIAGDDIVRDGKLDRKILASRLFADRQLLSEVEALVHPAVMRDFDRWKSERDCGAVIIESAILLERPGMRRQVDRTVVVTAPYDIRIMRVMERDCCSRREVISRMERQWSDSERIAAADWVIENDGRQPLLPQILNIIKNITYYYGKDRS